MTITWKSYLEKTTERMEGTSLRDAQIVCLGELHEHVWQHCWRKAIIDHYGSDGDIILKEGYSALEKVDVSKLPFVSRKKLLCYGCDDVSLVRKETQVMIEMVKLTNKYGSDAPNAAWSRKDREQWDAYLKLDDVLCQKRTEVMIKTIKTLAAQLKPRQKIFIIAGSDHFYQNNSDTMYNILNHLKKYKTAVLLPLSVVDPLEDSKSYMKKIAEAYSTK